MSAESARCISENQISDNENYIKISSESIFKRICSRFLGLQQFLLCLLTRYVSICYTSRNTHDWRVFL